MSNRPPPLYALDLSHLSDEHMRHIYRFLKLGPFNRADHDGGRRYYLARLKQRDYERSIRAIEASHCDKPHCS